MLTCLIRFISLSTHRQPDDSTAPRWCTAEPSSALTLSPTLTLTPSHAITHTKRARARTHTRAHAHARTCTRARKHTHTHTGKELQCFRGHAKAVLVARFISDKFMISAGL